MMDKLYQQHEMEIIDFRYDDIVVTSGIRIESYNPEKVDS